MNDDAARWDARHRARLAEVSSTRAVAPDARALVDDTVIPRVGTALDVACGLGAQTIWLAARGLHVVALDVSAVAVAATRDAATACGVGEFVTVRRWDLDDGLPDDLGAFDVVVCQRFRPPDGYGDLVDALRPGGIALVTVLSTVGAQAPGPFHAPPGELTSAFSGHAVLGASEADGVASIVVRRV